MGSFVPAFSRSVSLGSMTDAEFEAKMPEAAAYLRDLRELGVEEVVKRRESSDHMERLRRGRDIAAKDPRVRLYGDRRG